MYKITIICQNKHMVKKISREKKIVILLILITLTLILSATVVVLGVSFFRNEPVYNGIFV